ncbi:5'-3' exonuclease H3TH domain-containing protein [Rhodococcus sp. X156]|uniref:5'-3' exonuclease n=1 Tax=Rhodococcus sp. X156 TaxID=2499145 RepID=UPI0013E3E945|nr:5'-3' exonuclease H3TH domain-containing protein [Rhodococcus sp. X156]
MHPEDPADRPVLLAVDGNSLIHRSYHALKHSELRAADGSPTWALKGLLSQLVGGVRRVGADAVVVGLDDSTSNVRKMRYPAYKAHRADKPEDLLVQLAAAGPLLNAAGVHTVVAPGMEADDVVASAAAHAAVAGWDTVVMTSDRDAFALVSDTCKVLRLINGGVDASPLLNPQRMHILNGVHPHQYRDYAAMRGDTSDNLPGIRGVGPKSAVKLLAEFDTVEQAFADVDDNDGLRVAKAAGQSMVAKLRDADSRAAYRRNVELMTMATDLELGLALSAVDGAGRLPVAEDALRAALADAQLGAIAESAAVALAHCEPRPRFIQAGPASQGAPHPAEAPPARTRTRATARAPEPESLQLSLFG